MRRRHLPTTTVLLCLLALSLRAERPEPEEREGEGRDRAAHGPTKGDKGDTSLEDVMDEMNDAFRALRRQVADPAKNLASLKLAAALRALALRAGTLQPRMVRHAPREEQAGLMSLYQARMKELVATIGDLEAALKAGKNGRAADILDDLKELQRAGHRKFRTDN